jgi:hypothetical protein
VLVAPNVGTTVDMPTLVCWTPATDFLWHLVTLGPIDATDMTEDALWRAAADLAALARAYAGNVPAFARACALAEAGGPIAALLAAMDPVATSGPGTHASVPGVESKRVRAAVLDRLILLTGRRDDHSSSLLEVRRCAKRELGVEIKSYEWLLGALGGKLYRHGAETR